MDLRINIPDNMQIISDQNEEEQENTQAYWKQKLVEKDQRLSQILDDVQPHQQNQFSTSDQNHFDPANFLYDLYKTSTVKEIDQFKLLIQDSQIEIVQKRIKDKLGDDSIFQNLESLWTKKQLKALSEKQQMELTQQFFCQQNQIVQMNTDILDANSQFQEKKEIFQKLNSQISKMENEILNSIEIQQEHLNSIKNVHQQQENLNLLKQIFQSYQQVQFFYDFDNNQILDATSLSNQLREHQSFQSVFFNNEFLSKDAKEILNLNEVKAINIRIQNIKDQLLKQTEERFDDGIQKQDSKILRECIIIFFNLEILREIIQSKVNQTLKQISQSWRSAVSNIQNLSIQINSVQLSKTEESQFIRSILVEAIDEMRISTQKIYTLSKCLQERDPVCENVFQTVQEFDFSTFNYNMLLQGQNEQSNNNQSQASSIANIFILFSEKLFHIIKQTLEKMSSNSGTYTFALQTLSQSHYKFFVKDCLYDNLYMNGILNHIDQSEGGAGSGCQERVNIVRQLKIPLFSSIQILKEKYIQNQYVQQASESKRQLIFTIVSDLSKSCDFGQEQQNKLDSKKLLIDDQFQKIINIFESEYLNTIMQEAIDLCNIVHLDLKKLLIDQTILPELTTLRKSLCEQVIELQSQISQKERKINEKNEDKRKKDEELKQKRENEKKEREIQEKQFKSQEVVNPYLLLQIEERKQKEEKQKIVEIDEGIIVFDQQNCIEQLIINLIEQKMKIILKKFCDTNNLEIQ